MEILDYTTKGGKNLIVEYIESLPSSLRVIAYQIRKNIAEDGLLVFEVLNTRQLKGKLWKIKFSDQRIMYVIRDQDAVYFLHMCKKENEKRKRKI